MYLLKMTIAGKHDPRFDIEGSSMGISMCRNS